MATVYTRASKGSALTWAEGDANINNLNSAKLESENAGTTGQILTKTSTGAQWETFSGGASTLNDLTDVTVTSPGADQVLKYDTLTNQWINATPSTPSIALDGLSDVTVTTPSNGQALVYNSSTFQWTNQTLSSGGISNVVEDTTPQLGGNLDVNGNSIVSTSNANINITPDGTGKVVTTKQLDANILRSTQSAGDEGGELQLALAATNTTLSGSVAIDINQNRLRIFETGGSNRGVYVDLSAASTGVGTNLISSGGLTDIVNDTTPQLGGNLDVQSNTITTSVTNGDIKLSPNGFGSVLVGTGSYQSYISSQGSQALTLWTNNGGNTGNITINAGASGDIALTTSPSGNGNITITPSGTGQTVIKNLEYNENIYSLGTTSGTIAPNVANGNVQTITLNGNLTLNAFTSPVAGQSLTLIINTNGTGRTLTSTMKFANGDKTLSATSTTDIITVFYDGTNYWASLGKGFA